MSPTLPEPHHNPHLFGHEAVVARFRQALARGRLHHAWLLTGPVGVGKSTLAWHLARLWLAHGDLRAARDPAHPLFRTTASGAHPDLLVPRPPASARSREIPVEAVRELQARLHVGGGSRRAVLLDPVEQLNRHAANALLKLLEEPPRGVLFLLVAERPGAVPPTLLSRAVRTPLAPLAPAQLEQALTTLGPEASPEQRRQAAALARGCPGRALRLLGADLPERYAALLEAVAAGSGPSPAAVDALAARLREEGVEEALAPLSLLLERLVQVAAGREPAVALVAEEGERLAAIACRRPLAEWAALWEKLAGFARRAERLHLDPAATALVLLAGLYGRESAVILESVP